MELQKLSVELFEKMSKLVYDRTGIDMPESKLGMLSNRLRKRLRALELDSFEEYYKLLRNSKRCEEELPNFLSAVTTNETYFFRNERLWKDMRQTLIPWMVKTRAKTRSIRIWSAASSSGEEAYTTAISLREEVPDIDKWNITIVGTDISKNVLDKAAAAVYNDYAVNKMTPGQIKRWFDVKEGEYRLRDPVRKMVKFQFHNLRDAHPQGRFDLVFLRNVLMYFDNGMKKRVIGHVCNAVAPNGHLIVGDVDPIRTVAELSSSMPLDYKRPGLYYKPAACGAATRKEPVNA